MIAIRSRGLAGLVAMAALVACGSAPPRALTPPPASPLARVDACRREPPARCEGVSFTYGRDVLPILTKRCFACHAPPGEAADDHDFSRVDTLRAQRSALLGEIGACAMPPPPAPPIPSSEADVLLAWAACGAPP